MIEDMRLETTWQMNKVLRSVILVSIWRISSSGKWFKDVGLMFVSGDFSISFIFINMKPYWLIAVFLLFHPILKKEML